MGLLFFDGFETYATADLSKVWDSVTSSPAINPTGGRRGGGSLEAPNNHNTQRNVIKNLNVNYSTLVAGFNFNPSGMNASNFSFFRFLDSSTVQVALFVSNTGAITVYRGNGTSLLGTASSGITIGADNYIEVKVTFHNTAGAVEVRINGVTVFNESGLNTRSSSNNYANAVSIGNATTLSSFYTWVYDDFYVLDTSGTTNNTFLGDVRIDAVYPTADGEYSGWTPSEGVDHYALVDEATPNTTDYVSSDTAAQKDSYVMGNPPVLSSQIIYGVGVKVAALKDDAGSRSIKVGVRSGITDSVSDSQALTTSQKYYMKVFDKDPNTNDDWTPEAVDNVQALIESV